MQIAIGQMNSTLGDVWANADKIIKWSNEASNHKKDLIVFPELSLVGYSPNDLLERPELFLEQEKALKKIAKNTSSKISILVGCLNKDSFGRLFNSAALIQKNKIVKFFNKELLPNYDVFDESRHFFKGDLSKNFFRLKGKNVLVAICEDLWFEEMDKYDNDPLKNIKKKPDHLISLNASPFSKGKQRKRERIIKNITNKLKCNCTYVNLIGAQDELIFDGQSFNVSDHKVTLRLPSFEEHLHIEDNPVFKVKTKHQEIESALVLGIKDYFRKTGFKKAHLGLSGGIDSALVLYLAVKALGSENVTAIAMPGPYSSDLSYTLAKKLSENLNVKFITHDINKGYKSFSTSFEKTFGEEDFGLVHENTQARLRGLSLMAFSNKSDSQSLLLATSNKSELCVGYSTLYGDQCGALMPIGDLLKTEVFSLCEWINENYDDVIPKEIITRPPSAELRPNQKDSDSLPDYKELDRSIEKIITKQKKAITKLDKWVLNRSFMSEFKRWQSAPILRISTHAFGRGRRMPLAQNLKV